MIDVKALLQGSKSVGVVRCGTCAWLQSRPEDERKQWEAALEDKGSWASANVARAMRQVESDVTAPGDTSISNHRSGHVRGTRK
jgi:hypothetical protein